MGSWCEALVQLAAFLLLVWLTQVSGLFTVGDGSILERWNWYLIPLFPFPLLFLLYKRFCKDEVKAAQRTRKAFVAYTLMLVLFMAATPLSSQLDITHQLITATIAVRSLSYGMIKN